MIRHFKQALKSDWLFSFSVPQGRSWVGGPGVPVIPLCRLCKPFLSKQPTIFRGENAMTILFGPV